MDYHKINRAHESAEHISMKRDGIKSLTRRGFTPLFPEHYYCDVVAVRLIKSNAVMVGVEFERSPRNVIRNVTRNFTNGCNFNLIVTSTSSVYESCVRKLQKHLSIDERECTFIITFDDFIEGKLPHHLLFLKLCSNFVQKPSPVCSALFSFVQLCSRKKGLCSEGE